MTSEEKVNRTREHIATLRVIRRIRDSFEGSVDVYTKGRCIQFALILQEVYRDGTIYWNEDHAIFKRGEYFYDITGVTRCTNHIPLIDYGVLHIINLIEQDDNTSRV